jgi:hypothetical protein
MGVQPMGLPPWPPEERQLIAKRYQRSNGTPRNPFGCNAVLYGVHALEGLVTSWDGDALES